MWQLLLTLLLVAKVQGSDKPPINPSSVGPTSAMEADFLYENGVSEFSNSSFEEAAIKLKRLVDRYPGHKKYIDAHLWLGKALFEAGQPNDAIPPLKYFASASRRNASILEAKVLIGKSLVKLGKNTQAYLLATETQSLAQKQNDGLTTAEALIIKALALVGLNRDGEAHAMADAATRLLKENGNSAAQARGLAVKLKLKARECAKLGVTGPLTEEQTRDQLRRRGLCTLDALTVFHGVLALAQTASGTTGAARTAEETTSEISHVFDSYHNACVTPRDSVIVPPGKKRSRKQLARYKQELIDVLKEDCRKTEVDASDLVSTWKKSSTAFAIQRLDSLAVRLEKLIAPSK